MSRHFVWLIPCTNLCLFLAIGIILKLLLLVWPKRVSWLAPRLLCSLTALLLLLVGFPRIHGLAWFVVTLGIAARTVPALEGHAAGFCRLGRFSLPLIACVAPVIAATLWAQDWINDWRCRQGHFPRPAPPISS